MKNLSIILIISILTSCSGYVPFTTDDKKFLEEEGVDINKVQFYIFNEIILFKKEKLQDNNPLKSKGKIRIQENRKRKIRTFKNNQAVKVLADKSSPNILYVKPDRSSNRTLKFMQLSSIDTENRSNFINRYGLNKSPKMEKMYYLIPNNMSSRSVKKEIYATGSFWKFLYPNKKNLYCGDIIWGDENYQIYFKKAPNLFISKKERKKFITDKKRYKGNYVE